MKTTKRKAVGGYHTTTTAIKKTQPNIASGCKKRHAILKCCATVITGAKHTTKLAGNLPDSEVFSRPEFASAGSSCLHGFGRDGANRKAARTTNFVCLTSRPPVARKQSASGFQSQLGAKAMTNVITLASRKASPAAATTAITTKPAPGKIERQQGIENALSMALHYIRSGDHPSNLHAATVKALRAATMLKQACADLSIGGRA